jgi:hypothetical protein
MYRTRFLALVASVLLLAAAANTAQANPLAGRQLRQLMQQGSKYEECNKVRNSHLIPLLVCSHAACCYST